MQGESASHHSAVVAAVLQRAASRLAHQEDIRSKAPLKIYKDECAYTFDSPFSEAGLFVNLTTLVAVSRRFVAPDAARTQNEVYLHEKFSQLPKAIAAAAASEAGGGGLEGKELAVAAPADPFEIVKTHSVRLS